MISPAAAQHLLHRLRVSENDWVEVIAGSRSPTQSFQKENTAILTDKHHFWWYKTIPAEVLNPVVKNDLGNSSLKWLGQRFLCCSEGVMPLTCSPVRVTNCVSVLVPLSQLIFQGCRDGSNFARWCDKQETGSNLARWYATNETQLPWLALYGSTKCKTPVSCLCVLWYATEIFLRFCVFLTLLG